MVKNLFLNSLVLLSVSLWSQEDTVKVNLGLNPEQNAEQQYNNGLKALRDKDFTGAADLFTNFLAGKPGFEKALLNRAIAYTNLKRYEEALKDINEAIITNPRNEENYFNKSLIFAGMNLRDSQEVALDQCLAINGKHAEAAYYKGMLQYEAGQFEKSIGYYNIALETNPAFAFAYNDRASAKRAKGDTAGAIADYEAAVKADSSHAFIYSNLGSAYKLKGQMAKALEAYDKAIRRDRRYLLALINRGAMHFDNNNFKQAQLDFEEVLSIDGKNSHAYNNLSSIAIKQGDFKKAKELADRSISLDAANGPAYYNRGIARQMLREEEGSCSDWKKALSLGVTDAGLIINASCID